jgi:branched-chain amino acid transport system permease protein
MLDGVLPWNGWGSDSGAKYAAGVLLFAALGILPLALTSPDLRILIGVVYLMVFGMTWDVASGYTGQLNFGHAFFIAVGGYTTAILNVTHGYSPFISISAAIVVSALAGLLIGIPALRIRGVYLALVTFVAPFIFYQVVLLRDDIFMGSFGFRREPTAFAGVGDAIVSVQSSAMATIIDYYVAYALMIVVFLVLYGYTRSPAGPVLTAIREDEDAVSAVGLNPAKYKVFAFMLSAATGGLAGAMFVHSSVGFPQPDELLTAQLSLDVIIIAIIGGMGTIIGPLVGGLLFGGIDFLVGQIDYTIPFVGDPVEDIMPLPLFVLGIIIVYYEPRGLVPWLLRIGRSIRQGGTDTDRSEKPSSVEKTFERFRDELPRLRRSKE